MIEKRGRDGFFFPNFMKANWIGHIFRRNCLPQHTIEGKIREV